MSDIRTGPDPGLTDKLPVAEVLTGFDSIDILEYADPATSGLVEYPSQALLLVDDFGPRYGVIEYRLPLRGSDDEQNGAFIAGAEKPRELGSTGLIEVILSDASTIKSRAISDSIGPFYRALGFNYGNYHVSRGNDNGEAVAYILPTPERANVVLREVFGRSPEDGHTQFRTFRRPDGTSGQFSLGAFIEEMSEGYYPVSAAHPNGEALLFGHDVVDHLAGYALFSPDINYLVKEAAADSIRVSGAGYSFPKETIGKLADNVSMLLVKSLDNGGIVPAPSGLYVADDIFAYLRDQFHLRIKIGNLVKTRRELALQLIGKEVEVNPNKEPTPEDNEIITGLIQGLAENMSDMLNRAREYEQAEAA